MRSSILPIALCFLALALTATSAKNIVCYFASWSHYRQGNGRFTTADIDPNICTHYIWSFVTIEGNRIVVSDGDGSNGIRELTALRSQNSGAKVLVAVGGGSDSVGPKYSNMVSSWQSRNDFINSAVDVLKEYNLDGLDMDWEYPAFNGGVPSDRENFVLLLKELRERFNQEGGYLLTAAVNAGQWAAETAYDIPGISQQLDFINLMTYDFHGSWESQTGHHAGLHANGDISVESCVKYWLDKGCPKDKLVVGVPTYGKSWTLADPNNHGVGAPAVGVGQPGPYTQAPGTLAYNELCEQINAGQWTVVFDEQAYVPYAYNGNQWVGYENVQSAKGKAGFLRDWGLAGAMVWTIDFDDFRGSCGERYPILNALNAVLRT
ncbi:chitotriosidase-1 [Fopius arisanus]|uniref:Chitotriosidase-1 n=1 Tax=Fopius arisanus TaxID=64838 RepID=A0A9R1U5F7_9HYME|nr:PREDICTED: chitotriosidase-1-like [Fopius arisanus]XP_011307756.1 PREDICTED: chitotriosidase-1-like [Fopius arisanus]